MNLLYIYQKPIILSLFKLDTLNKLHHVYFREFDIPLKPRLNSFIY